MGKNIGNNIGKTWSGKYSQKLIDHAKQSTTDACKTSSKMAIQKTAGKLVIWLVKKLLTRLQKSRKLLHMKKKILELIEKYLEKDVYPRKKTENFW